MRILRDEKEMGNPHPLHQKSIFSFSYLSLSFCFDVSIPPTFAVIFTGILGYSALMRDDEHNAFDAIKCHLEKLKSIINEVRN